MKRSIIITIWLLSMCLLVACGNNNDSANRNNNPVNQPPKQSTEDPVQTPNAETDKQQVMAAAEQVVEILKRRDAQSLSEWIHPDKGVRFSPYSYVNIDQDIVVMKDELQGLLDSDEVKTWGNYDGSGEPITITFSEYFDRFIYDKDFMNSTEVSYNQRIGQGNTVNNVFEAYPNANVVEYYIEGVEPESLDWASLRLAFERTEQGWRLVGIIHDQWTI